MSLPQRQKIYTIDDIYSLPNGQRAELIGGQIYYMAPPSRAHQRITLELSTIINNHIKKNGGFCGPKNFPVVLFF